MTCLGLVHNLAFSTVAWVFPGHLFVVSRRLGSPVSFETWKIPCKLPTGALLGGLLHERGNGQWEAVLEFIHAEQHRRTFIFDFVLGSNSNSDAGTLFPACSKHHSRERTPHAPWGRRTQGWMPPHKEEGEVWSGILPGMKIRRAWRTGQDIHVETFSLKGTTFLRTGKGSQRTSWAGERDLVDIHPTRGDLFLMRDQGGPRKYAVLQLRKRTWSWIPQRASEQPTWTRLWFKCFDSHLRHPFEFWDGTVFGLGQDSAPFRIWT